MMSHSKMSLKEHGDDGQDGDDHGDGRDLENKNLLKEIEKIKVRRHQISRLLDFPHLFSRFWNICKKMFRPYKPTIKINIKKLFRPHPPSRE